jgi:hypothetical protein
MTWSQNLEKYVESHNDVLAVMSNVRTRRNPYVAEMMYSLALTGNVIQSNDNLLCAFVSSLFPKEYGKCLLSRSFLRALP